MGGAGNCAAHLTAPRCLALRSPQPGETGLPQGPAAAPRARPCLRQPCSPPALRLGLGGDTPPAGLKWALSAGPPHHPAGSPGICRFTSSLPHHPITRDPTSRMLGRTCFASDPSRSLPSLSMNPRRDTTPSHGGLLGSGYGLPRILRFPYRTCWRTKWAQLTPVCLFPR